MSPSILGLVKLRLRPFRREFISFAHPRPRPRSAACMHAKLRSNERTNGPSEAVKSAFRSDGHSMQKPGRERPEAMTNEKFGGNRKKSQEKSPFSPLFTLFIRRPDTEPDAAAAPRHTAAAEEGTGTAGAARVGARTESQEEDGGGRGRRYRRRRRGRQQHGVDELAAVREEEQQEKEDELALQER